MTLTGNTEDLEEYLRNKHKLLLFDKLSMSLEEIFITELGGAGYGKKNNFMPLLIYSIKEKKNWVLLSTVIIFLTTLVIPYILRADNEFFIMFGIFELFVLILINCLVDNSFLHNESKLTYYMSKPVPLSRQIMINIVANTVFTVYLLVLIIVSVLIQDVDNEILRVFKMLIPGFRQLSFSHPCPRSCRETP